MRTFDICERCNKIVPLEDMGIIINHGLNPNKKWCINCINKENKSGGGL